MADFKELFGWLAQKKLASVSFSWKFGKGEKPDKIEWIATHKKEEKENERRPGDPILRDPD